MTLAKLKSYSLKGLPCFVCNSFTMHGSCRVQKRFLASNPLQILTGIIHYSQKVAAEMLGISIFGESGFGHIAITEV